MRKPIFVDVPFLTLHTTVDPLAPGPVESSPYQNCKRNFKRVHDLDTPILFVGYPSKPIGSANKLFQPLGVSNSTRGGMTPTTAPRSLERGGYDSLVRRFKGPIYGQQHTHVPIPAPLPIGFGTPSSQMMMPLPMVPTCGDDEDDGADRFDLPGQYTVECGRWEWCVEDARCADEDMLSMGLSCEIGFLFYSLLHFLCMEGPFYLLSWSLNIFLFLSLYPFRSIFTCYDIRIILYTLHMARKTRLTI